MAKYSRITGKVFGSSATGTGDNPEIGQFGSALAGTYRGTTDVATIQSLTAWSKGFIDAVTPNTQFPALPEMTGFGKVLSHQICYLLQQGVAEWDSGTTYYTDNWCSYNGSLYTSIVDDNTNNLPTDVTKWTKFTGGSSRNLGEYVTSSLPLNDTTLHLANGTQLSSTDYPELFSYAASIYTGTMEWQTIYQPYTPQGQERVTGAAFGNNIQMFICDDHIIVYHNIGNQTWANATPLSGSFWKDVAYGNNCFVAINKNGKIYKSVSNNYSDLGSSWSSLVELSGSNWYRIAYGNGTYVALTTTGETSISTDNGANWSTPASAISSVSADWSGITYDGTQFIAISTNGYISTSTNGTTWVNPSQIANLSSHSWTDIAFDGTTYMVIDYYGYVSTSTNLTTWTTPVRDLGSVFNWIAVAPSYKGFYAVATLAYVKEQEIIPAAPFTTEADWQANYSTYGECGKYVYDAENNTLRIPLIKSYFKNTIDVSELGNQISASAPNIKGTFSGLGQEGDGILSTHTGAFYIAETNRPEGGVEVNNTGQKEDILGFDASRSSSIYSDSATTINPQAIEQLVYIVVKK